MLNLSRLKPRFWDHRDAAADRGSDHFSFRRKWLILVAFTMAVSLTPLLVMTLMDYRLSRKAFETEAAMNVSRMVSNTWRGIAFLLSERRAALAFVARDNTLADLLKPGRLEAVLANLQHGMAGFVDLSVVAPDGTLRAWAGPPDPPHRRSAPEDGFRHPVGKAHHIGDVTTRQGQADHLMVSIRQDLDSGGFFLLRATLDAALLEGPLSQLALNAGDDAFLVNTRGILQTRSRQYGSRYDRVPLPIPEPLDGTQVIQTEDPAGRAIILGVAPVADSPFVLMMVRQASGIMDLWFKPRLRLIGFLILSIVLILASIVTMATYLVNRIHAADRRRAHALHQMANANKLASLGRLAAGVAHEINNPLAIINQKAGLIQDLFTIKARYAADPKILGLVEDVLVSVRRCGAITRRLLDFARHMDSEIEAVDIEAVVHQILAFMEKDAQRRCIAITVTVTGDIPVIEGDRGKLQQVFLNLINNALAAMADGGRLEVSVSRLGPHRVQVTVSDTGHGIPEADLKQVFEPFFSTRQGPAATGLGLSITYGMVTEMGGEIEVESQVDRGTRVTVTLPLQPPRTSPPPACTVDPARQPV
jgi:signal transduction histidine kinase